MPLLAVPILEGEHLEGVISMDSAHMNFFAADAQAALGSFASQIAETIRMARVAREQVHLEFEAFYHASKELSSMIDFEEIIRKLNLLCDEIVHSDFRAIAVSQADDTLYSVYEWPSHDEPPGAHDLQNNSRTSISSFIQSREEPSHPFRDTIEAARDAGSRPGGKARWAVHIPCRADDTQQAGIGALLLAARRKRRLLRAPKPPMCSPFSATRRRSASENSAIIKKNGTTGHHRRPRTYSSITATSRRRSTGELDAGREHSSSRSR